MTNDPSSSAPLPPRSIFTMNFRVFTMTHCGCSPYASRPCSIPWCRHSVPGTSASEGSSSSTDAATPQRSSERIVWVPPVLL
jgi:hypothetical protein